MAAIPNVLGRSITLDGVAHTIVGVLPNMPVPWVGPNGNEVWTTKPFVIPGFSHERMMRGTAFLRAVGRLKPGVTIEQAWAALPALEQSYRTQNPGKIDADLKTIIVPLPEDVTGRSAPGVRHAFRRRELSSCSSPAAMSPTFSSCVSAAGAARLRSAWRWARRAPVCCGFLFSKACS